MATLIEEILKTKIVANYKNTEEWENYKKDSLIYWKQNKSAFISYFNEHILFDYKNPEKSIMFIPNKDLLHPLFIKIPHFFPKDILHLCSLEAFSFFLEALNIKHTKVDEIYLLNHYFKEQGIIIDINSELP